MTQYDAIAHEYQEIADAVPIREPEWHALHLRLGDLTGLSVLDLACGDGMSSRRLKLGAPPTWSASTFQR